MQMEKRKNGDGRKWNMELGSIYHRAAFADCYARNREEIVIRIRTGKDITGVKLVCGDPYTAGISGESSWAGECVSMTLTKELKRSYLWEAVIAPFYKRLQYYFEIESKDERIFLLEDDFYTPEEFERAGLMKQHFKFPWLNESDIYETPEWVSDVVWYQIMPDRFAKGNAGKKRHELKDWNNVAHMSYWDFFGGDLAGIIQKLDYLKELGISGIYLTPIFFSESNHKYDTTDYTRIDPDFGTEEEMIALTSRAHELGIKIMVDAVFNHCGTHFFAWQDVLKKGPDSEYWDWFYVNQWPLPQKHADTKDGRYYSFAFAEGMPKLNTNNPAVADYFLNICRHWVEDWNIDGIRFDVGNEVSHTFLKLLNRKLKVCNPNLYLLGEIWHDATPWLLGDEYDSVMNYPFVESIQNFWGNRACDTRQLMYGLNYCYSLYREQTNWVLFNFLDTHDIGRAVTRCGSMDVFFQQLALLLTMQGAPCLYYGTEIAMEGGGDPYNRKPMPWDSIKAGKYDSVMDEVKQLIAMRNAMPQAKSGEVVWYHDRDESRLVHYKKRAQNAVTELEVYMNAGSDAVMVSEEGKQFFARNYREGQLLPGGIVIRER